MFALYTHSGERSSAWPEPIETAYQVQSRRAARLPGARRGDITIPMRLLIGSVVQLGESRPRGVITWLSEVVGTTRQTIYSIGNAAMAGPPAPESASAPHRNSRNTVVRAALVLLVAGAMRLRATQLCLATLLGHKVSLGWFSELVDEAGGRAGKVLQQADWSASHPMFVARDELYHNDRAYLLTVDTRSLSIVSHHVEAGADAAIWGLSLALDQERTGGKILGVAEDAARYFPASIAVGEDLLDEPWNPWVQKDVWHLLDHAGQVVTDAERVALAKLDAAEKKAHQVRRGLWRLTDPRDDGKAEHAQAAEAIDQADAIRTAVALLAPALAIVDRRSDRIMDRQTAGWYLHRIMDHLQQLGGPRGGTLADTLQRQAADLLTFHISLADQIEPWRRRAADHFGDAAVADLFERSVSRAWRLAREEVNGHLSPAAAARAATEVTALCRNDPTSVDLAEGLHAILEGVVRTSSAVECLNSLLRAYLWGRRHFHSRRTAQNWLNLLVLWHNLRPFSRGKRAGSCPFELAGVTVRNPDGQPSTDWLDTLGYAQAA